MRFARKRPTERRPEQIRKKESQPVDHTRHQADLTKTQQFREEARAKTLSRAIGEELRRAREAAGWSRLQLVARLPSGIGDRTLLSYEHGTRHLTVLRFLEICRALGVAAPTLLTQALQRTRLELANLVLRVDLHALLNDESDTYRPMVQWAKNKLNKFPRWCRGISAVLCGGAGRLRRLPLSGSRQLPSQVHTGDHRGGGSCCRSEV